MCAVKKSVSDINNSRGDGSIEKESSLGGGNMF